MKKRIAVMLALIFMLCYVPAIAVLADEDKNDAGESQTAEETTTAPAEEPTTVPASDEDETTTQPSSDNAETTEPATESTTEQAAGQTTEPAAETTVSSSAQNTKNPIKKYLTNHSILSYKYNPDGNYYYCDAANAWQRNYGYTRAFDLVAPYIMLEYDYIRVHFTYEGKDWLVQLWKGQYGSVFYGSEVGLYYKTSDGKSDTYTTHYNCPSDSDCIVMQTNLYHKNYVTGEYEFQFSTPTETTWWSTGFIPGHLVKEEPADELRQTGTLTFKNQEMTDAFVEALKGCGLPQVSSESKMTTDSFWTDGCSVHYSWQNLSSAENTMLIKSASGIALFLSSGIFSGVFVLAIGTFGALSLLAMLALK